MGNGFASYFKPEVTPAHEVVSKFPADFGFKGPRKERVMIATEEEMVSAKLELADRDYCAHKLLEYMACRADVWPWVYKCAPEKHEYNDCQYQDYIYRMKDYERERRLMERQVRIEKKQKLQGLAA